MEDDVLQVRIGSLSLPNPVMMASGCGGYGREYADYVDLGGLGAFVTKGLSLKPRMGNPPPRIWETSSGLINSIGLENIGIEEFLREHLFYLVSKGVVVIVNIFGEEERDYVELADRLNDREGVRAIELNLSCPNVRKGGVAFGRDPEVVFRLVEEVREATDLPLLVKLPPLLWDLLPLARAAWEGGAHALTIANTYPSMAIDPEARRPRLGNIVGGLSGPAIRPITLRLVWEVSRVSPIPVIGVGGIVRVEDALEYLIAGATAIQVGTGNFLDPSCCMGIIEGLKDYVVRHGLRSIRDIIGSLRLEAENQ